MALCFTTDAEIPAPTQSGFRLVSNVPDYAHLMDKKTGSLKHDHKVAVTEMLRRIRSALNDQKPADIMPPYELALYLLRVYHKEIHYLFPFICFSTFIRAYRGMNGDYGITTGFSPAPSYGLGGTVDEASTHPHMFLCALFTMLSHASKLTSMKERDKTFLSRAFWKCAVAHLSPALIKENSLAAVQTFLIVAVSSNSTRFPIGDERWLPVEIAYRLAQHMRLDDDGDGAMRFVRPSFKFQLPLASGLGTEVLVSAAAPSSGSAPLSFFTHCVARIEELEKIVQNMPKAPSRVLSQGDANRHSLNLAELREKVAKLRSALPASPDWTAIGIPVLEGDTIIKPIDAQKVQPNTWGSHALDSDAIDSEPEDWQAAVCNTSHMLIRSMLSRPIFIEEGIQECLASGEDVTTLTLTGEQKARSCALQCLTNAILLVNYMRRRSTPNNKIRTLWWDPCQIGTAGLVIIMAQTCELLWNSFDQTLIKQAWKFCQEMLVHDRFNSDFKQNVVTFLWNTNKSIGKDRMLANEYLLISPSPSVTLTDKGRGAFKAGTALDIDPLHLQPDGITRVPDYAAQMPNGGLPIGDDVDLGMSLPSVEDAPVVSADWFDSEAPTEAEIAAFLGPMPSDRPSLTPSLDTDFSFTPSTTDLDSTWTPSMMEMIVPSNQPSLTPSLDTDFSFADLDFTWTPSMMEMDFNVPYVMDPDFDGDAAQPTPSSEAPFSPSAWDMGTAYQGPFMPSTQQQSAGDAGMAACLNPPPSVSYGFVNQPPPTTSMPYSQPAPGSAVSASPLRVMQFNPSLPTEHGQSAVSNAPNQPPASFNPATSATTGATACPPVSAFPLQVIQYNPSLPTKHKQSAVSNAPNQPPASFNPAAGATGGATGAGAAFNSGNISLNGLKKQGGA
ncbi:hypothetical protein ACQKWADRAFT_325510 [Trichoderma austrokoningii]